MNKQRVVHDTMQQLGQALHACLNEDTNQARLQQVMLLLRTLRTLGSARLGAKAAQATALVQASLRPEGISKPEAAQLVRELQSLVYGLRQAPAGVETTHPSATNLARVPQTSNASELLEEKESLETSEVATEGALKTIYLFGANPLLAHDTALQVQCFGYRVVVAKGLDHLRTLMSQHPPDCIVVDAGMEGQPVFSMEKVAEIQALSKVSVPLLLLSPRSNFEARLAAVRAGVDAYLVKPVEIVALTERIDALTQRKQPYPYRVLIVCSDSARRAHYTGILSDAGMEIEGIQTPIELFRMLHQYRPELVIMDVNASSCTGVDLTTLIRQDKSLLDLPVLMLSEASGAHTRRSAIHAGADDFLLTPITAEDLVFSVANRIERSRSLRTLIMRDGLTGLYNHSSIKEHLVREIARSKRDATPLALAMVDLDHFKKINDSYGHPVGDQVIRAVSRMLRQRLRHGDLAGRYGGEEFVVIMPVTSASAASGVLDEMRSAFEKIQHRADDMEFFATFSAGVAELGDAAGMGDAGELLRIADMALYRAKQAGRNRIELASRYQGLPVLVSTRS